VRLALFQILAVSEDHRDAGAVFAVVKDLLHLELVGVKIYLRLAHELRFVRENIVAIDGRWDVVAGVDVKRFFVVLVAAETFHGALPWQLDFAKRLAGEVEDLRLTENVDHVLADDAATENADSVERFLAGGHDFGEMLAAGLIDVHRDDALGRRFQIGDEIELCSFIADERKLVVEVADELFEGRVGGRSGFADEHLVLRIGAAGDIEDHVLAVVSDAEAKVPVGVVGPAIHELVFFLLGAQLVEVHHLVQGRGLKLLAGLWLRIARVVEARPLLVPIGAAEAAPLHGIVELFAGFNFHHEDLLPIAAGFGARVCKQAGVVGHARAGKGNGAVFGPFVGVDQHAAFRFVRIGDVQHRLVLQAVVLRVEVIAAFFERG
jgi:hypothetical protein